MCFCAQSCLAACAGSCSPGFGDSCSGRQMSTRGVLSTACWKRVVGSWVYDMLGQARALGYTITLGHTITNRVCKHLNNEEELSDQIVALTYHES